MKVDYDFILAEIDKEVGNIDNQIAVEKMAGNVVKEAAEQGERVAFGKLRTWIARLKNLDGTPL